MPEGATAAGTVMAHRTGNGTRCALLSASGEIPYLEKAGYSDDFEQRQRFPGTASSIVI